MSLHSPDHPADNDELGALFLEYGLLITLIALAAAGVLLLLGGAVASRFGDPALLDWLTP